MGKSFTYQWKKSEYKEWKAIAKEDKLDYYPFEVCESSRFQSVGIRKSDSIYIVSCFDKKLYLLGKFDIYEVHFGPMDSNPHIGTNAFYTNPYSPPTALVSAVMTNIAFPPVNLIPPISICAVGACSSLISLFSYTDLKSFVPLAYQMQ